jgi:hypothetical protein
LLPPPIFEACACGHKERLEEDVTSALRVGSIGCPAAGGFLCGKTQETIAGPEPMSAFDPIAGRPIKNRVGSKVGIARHVLPATNPAAQ